MLFIFICTIVRFQQHPQVMFAITTFRTRSIARLPAIGELTSRLRHRASVHQAASFVMFAILRNAGSSASSNNFCASKLSAKGTTTAG